MTIISILKPLQTAKLFTTKLILMLVCIGCLFISVSYSTPQWQFYAPNLSASKWKAKSSKLECKLNQVIPQYGDAIFINRNGRKPVLEINTIQGPAIFEKANVYAIPAIWEHTSKPKYLGTVNIKAGYKPFYIPTNLTRRILSILADGLIPTIIYTSWREPNLEVSISLSTVRFHDAYETFLSCSDKLLPYSFKDVSLTIIYFKSGQIDVSDNELAKLRHIQNILKRYPEMKKITIDGYADSRGTRLKNWVLTEERIEAVADALINLGVNKQILQLRPHGEVSTKTGSNLASARRVEVRLTPKEPENSIYE